MRQQNHLGFWIGLVIVLSFLAIVTLIAAMASLFSASEQSAGIAPPIIPTFEPAQTSASVPTPAPTRLLTPTPASTATSQCKNNAILISQITSPDGSSLQPNQRFTQTWKAQNTGTCAWNARYQLVHVQNERLSTASPVALGSNVLPGQSAELKIAMVAPANPGQYISHWQLQDDQGTRFGAVLAVGIRVSLPTPTVCMPQIATFTADRATLNPGESTTLHWGAIINGQRVEIDNGIGVVAAPGSRVVAPAQTTTFTLSATCSGNRVAKSVTITVSASGQPTNTSVPPRRDILGIWANDKYTFQIMDVTNCAGAECQVRGEYAEWGSGPPVPGLVTGTFNVDTGKIVLSITMQSTTKSFDGKIDASNKVMSGQLTGAGTITLIRQQ